ncbi:MAG TPA: thioesterase family protein [Gemmataceae bacterium]|jgi:YbgC/YbaW family acyl-CoA thioester hydrolase|nr:thioesterase family protein [Gemmataceae bacterium]
MPPSPFQTTRRIEFADTDMAGIVHFANFFRFMEAAEQEFLRARGLSVALDWEGQALGFPRVSASCDYLKPAYFEDVLDVTVRVARIGRKSVTYAFEFSRAGDLIARGQVSSVCCRVVADQELESLEIPPAVRQRLEQPATAGAG